MAALERIGWGTVSSAERTAVATLRDGLFVGYSDRGTWVRRPEVIVYVIEDEAK
ncbi:hypothetical protein Psi02_72250 [Planotetraspora silvatica]|uniref:Uncharacterized protein n=1 Tax=Planotetraspora silvatica TaxID=234614 RepID=A0A8J3UU69_9ACTN|nr:hypothetical protein [Planotetraspora silvatica]GII50801.1 hypothetical protein Psi02_72250 [Planotetraspora silvatica]